MIPKVVGLLLLAPVLLLGILFFRAEVYFPRRAVESPCNVTHTPIGGDQIVQRFAKALTIATITRGNRDYDGEPRLHFARFLASSKLLFCQLLCSLNYLFPNRLSDHLLLATGKRGNSKQLQSTVQHQRER